MRLEFCKYFGALELTVKPLIDKWVHILPSWVQELYINYDSTVTAAAEAHVCSDYRRLSISLGTRWNDTCEAEQERIIVHELCHAYNVPISRVSLEALDDIFPESTPGKAMAARHIRSALEGCNTDLTELVLRLCQ